MYSNVRNFKDDLKKYRPHFLIVVPRLLETIWKVCARDQLLLLPRSADEEAAGESRPAKRRDGSLRSSRRPSRTMIFGLLISGGPCAGRPSPLARPSAAEAVPWGAVRCRGLNGYEFYDLSANDAQELPTEWDNALRIEAAHPNPVRLGKHGS